MSDDPQGAARTGPHLFGNGRVAYIQIPAIDDRKSGEFYAGVLPDTITNGRSGCRDS